MWRAPMPSLANTFASIAPDLPEIGDSGIPSNGLDMNNSCRSHARSGNTPGRQKRPCDGHDIGLMVAYEHAAQFSRETVAAVPNHFARTTNEVVAEQICGYGPADTRYFDPRNEPKFR